MSILQFGAGNIGRCLIYPWVKKQTNDVILIDNNKELVEKLIIL
jgi:mannitol-1-phosphate/altronate dehydrogenase